MLTAIRQFFTPPLFPDDEDKTRTARALYALLANMLIALTLAALATIFVFLQKAFAGLVISSLLALILISYALAQRGRVRLASTLFVAGIWMVFTPWLLLYGTTTNPIIAEHVALAVIAGILLGRWAATITAALSCSVGLGLAILENAGYPLIHFFPSPPLSSWIGWVLAYLWMLPPLYLTLQGSAQALARARKSEKRYRDLFDHSTVGIFQSSVEGRYLSVNPAMARIFGYDSTEEMLALVTDIASQIHVDPARRQEFKRVLTEVRQITEFTNQNYRKDGSIIWTSTDARVVKNGEGQVLYYEGFMTDITKRKRAEDALRQSEEQYRALFDNLPIPAFTKDLDGTYTSCNKENRRYFADNPVGRTDVEATPPEIAAILQANDQIVIKKGAAVEIEELLKNTPLGDRLCITHKVPLRDGQRNIIGVLGASLDITERKRADQALRDSQERFHSYFELGLIGMAISSPTKGLIEVNEQMCKILGYERSELVQLTWDKITHPDDLAADAVNFDRVMNGEIDGYSLDKRWIGKGGRVIDSTISVKCLRRQDGSVDYFVALAEDITERKRTEEALRESEAKLKTIIEILPVGVSAIDAERRISLANPALERILEISSEDLFMGALQNQEYLRADGTRMPIEELPSMRALTEQKAVHNVETGVVKEDSRVIWTSVSAAPIEFSNLQVVVATADITDRKRAEEALRESEASLRASQRIAHVGHWTWDIIKNKVTWSDEMQRIFGIDPEEFGGDLAQIIEQAIHPDDREKVAKANELVMTEEKPAPLEYRVVWPDQSVHTVWAVPGDKVTDKNGKTLKLTGIVEDITELKHQESALRESHARFSTIFQSSPVATSLRTLADGRCLDVNEAYLRLSEYSREELVNHTILEIGVWKNSSEYRQFVDRLAQKHYVKNVETAFQTKSGQTRHVLASYEKIQLEGEDCILALFQDITERKQAEEELQQAHEELRSLTLYWQNAIEAQRTHIAREIHDEFGQSMSALKMDLTWLTNRLPEEDERVARIRTMTDLVDSSIAQMRRIATELRPGLLDDLGLNAALEWQASEFYRRTEILCNLKLPDDDLALDPTLNTTLFRIFQEALTNVLRHAQATRVDASFQQEGETLVLTVQDNGRGITEDELNNPHSLGLLGMRERAAQWGGTLTHRGKAGEGTTVTVRLPLPASTVKGGNR